MNEFRDILPEDNSVIDLDVNYNIKIQRVLTLDNKPSKFVLTHIRQLTGQWTVSVVTDKYPLVIPSEFSQKYFGKITKQYLTDEGSILLLNVDLNRNFFKPGNINLYIKDIFGFDTFTIKLYPAVGIYLSYNGMKAHFITNKIGVLHIDSNESKKSYIVSNIFEGDIYKATKKVEFPQVTFSSHLVSTESMPFINVATQYVSTYGKAFVSNILNNYQDLSVYEALIIAAIKTKNNLFKLVKQLGV